ncbi:MAG: type IX secretion system membrane protein PorP/SprF, partial [Yersinia sp. (in: enterobacteria)]
KNAPERSITPAFIYKAQGKFDQLDVGMYLTYEPVVFGLWYRGLTGINPPFGGGKSTTSYRYTLLLTAVYHSINQNKTP